MAKYDVVIIGGGPGGYNGAIRAGQLGLSIACVEKRATLGGTCLNVGCIPSKSLLHASEMFELASTGFAGFGILTKPKLDLPTVMSQKAASVAQLTKGVEFLFKKNRVDWIRGEGRLLEGSLVEVRSDDGVTTILEAGAIVIASGSEPTPLAGLTVDGDRIVDSTGALIFDEVPSSLIVIGAGIIGLELGSVWRRLGSKVTVVEFLDRVTPGADAEIARALQRSLTKQGIVFRLGAKVTNVQASDASVRVVLEPVAGGGAETLAADKVLVSVGRRPFTEGLNLEGVGVRRDRGGFIETTQFQTSVPGIYAIGDATHGPMLAHKAEDEAVACIELIAGRDGEVNPGVIPSVIYTHPEVAWVGQNEEELKAAGVAFKSGKFAFTANARARVNHEAEGLVKVLADAVSDRVLGVHMIGPDVSEMIGECCLAMEFSASSEDIARTSHPHPTRSEALRQAAMGVEGWTMQS